MNSLRENIDDILVRLVLAVYKTGPCRLNCLISWRVKKKKNGPQELDYLDLTIFHANDPSRKNAHPV